MSDRYRSDNSLVPLEQEQPLRQSIYCGVRFAQKIRHWIAADKKPIFDVEADPELWDKSVKVKAKAAGISVEEYEAILKGFQSRPLFRLAITIMRCENDFLENWWKNLKKAEKLAHELIDIESNIVLDDKGNEASFASLLALKEKGAQLLLKVEREKMMGIKRLVETGRMIDPTKYAARKPRKPKEEEPFEPSKTGVIEIDT